MGPTSYKVKEAFEKGGTQTIRTSYLNLTSYALINPCKRLTISNFNKKKDIELDLKNNIS